MTEDETTKTKTIINKLTEKLEDTALQVLLTIREHEPESIESGRLVSAIYQTVDDLGLDDEGEKFSVIATCLAKVFGGSNINSGTLPLNNAYRQVKKDIEHISIEAFKQIQKIESDLYKEMKDLLEKRFLNLKMNPDGIEKAALWLHFISQTRLCKISEDSELYGRMNNRPRICYINKGSSV